jgi:uncharacterized protein YodC (DUF2158 family)
MRKIKQLLQDVVNKFIRPPSKFKVNEAVQHSSGGSLMVVSGFVYHAENELHVICQWYDRAERITMRQEFPEHELKAFDWYNPKDS